MKKIANLIAIDNSAIDRHNADLLTLKGRLHPDPETGTVLRYEPPDPRQVLGLLYDVQRRWLHALGRPFHLDFAILLVRKSNEYQYLITLLTDEISNQCYPETETATKKREKPPKGYIFQTTLKIS